MLLRHYSYTTQMSFIGNEIWHGGGDVAELVARPPTDPKVRGLNHRGPKYS
jgi:hypothetical protein